MTPERLKCTTKSCEAEAVWRVAWPGKPADFCRPCTRRAVRVAEAMGFAPALALHALIVPVCEACGGTGMLQLDFQPWEVQCGKCRPGGIPRGPELDAETKVCAHGYGYDAASSDEHWKMHGGPSQDCETKREGES